MNLILLSGGSGMRLWPLSNEVRSKQFIKIFRAPDDTPESMVQRMYRQIKKADTNARMTIATAESQASSIRNHLGEGVDLCIEPCRRDTFPAIALAVLYLHEKKGVPKDEAVVVLPVDPYVDDSYFETVKKMYELAGERQSGLTVMGIAPTYPSEKYGYVMPASADPVTSVKTFREKPDAASAQRYIDEGGLWNGGVFAFRMSYMLDVIRRECGYSHYADLLENYAGVKKISFDYAVAEKEEDITLIRYDGAWKDVGSWLTLTETMEEQSVGNVMSDDGCENVHVINELNVPILCMGMKDAVICASPDGILVSDKGASSYMKPYVEQLDTRVMYAEKSWGSFKIIDATEASLTIRVSLNAGHGMHYHSHGHRDEIWTAVSGEGVATIDGKEIPVKPGDVLRMNAGTKHRVVAKTPLVLIEVQLGRDISVEDKTVFPEEE